MEGETTAFYVRNEILLFSPKVGQHPAWYTARFKISSQVTSPYLMYESAYIQSK